MLLTIGERLIIMNVLPQEGDLLTLTTVREAQATLNPTDQERKAVDLTLEAGTFTWREDLDEPSEVALSDGARRVLFDRLKELDGRKKLQMVHLTLYERLLRDEAVRAAEELTKGEAE